jgi:hypothetical protein
MITKRILLAALAGLLLTSCTNSVKDLRQITDTQKLRTNSKSQLTNKSTSRESCTEPFNDMVLGADDLVADYLSNPISFDANYKGRCIAV